MDKRDIEAYLNEYKGAIFEFKVALEYSLLSGVAQDYLDSIPKKDISRLTEYEKKLISIDRSKSHQLAKFSLALAKEFYINIGKSEKVRLIAREKEEKYKEGDFLIYQNNKATPVSLKLCKHKAFINTKSAGIKSFFSKYFSAFEKANEIQNSINEQLSSSFYRMSDKLHEEVGIKYKGNYSEWTLPDRPGKLSSNLSEIIKEHYKEMNKILYNNIKTLYKYDQKKFKKSLFPLIGVGSNEVIQLTLLYKNDEIKSIYIQDSKNAMDELSEIQIKQFNPELASFMILLKNLKLQIRVKPMNSFTQEAMKINCSIQH